MSNKQTKSKRAKVATAPEAAKKTFPEVPNVALRRALEAAGGYPQLGDALGVSRQSIHKWDAVPDRFAVRLEQLYGIPRHVTAPHLYEGMAVK